MLERECRARILFLSGVSGINEFVDRALKGTPVFDFLAEDAVRHELWTISGARTSAFLEKAFLSVPDLYVADGHHRTAAAARVGQKRKDSNSDHRGNEEYNFFMAVLFPDDQLEIFDYNRVVKDLNGLSPSDFLRAPCRLISKSGPPGNLAPGPPV